MNQWDFPGRSVSQPAQNLQGIIEQLAENVHPFLCVGDIRGGVGAPGLRCALTRIPGRRQAHDFSFAAFLH